MQHAPTPYRVPRQKRSRESLERLLEAAEQQIRATGLESLTIADVVSRAGMSVGAFYSRFPDKTALLRAVQDRFHDKHEPCIQTELLAVPDEEETLDQAVCRTVDILVKHVVGERELSRSFMMSSVFDPVIRERGEQVNRERRRTMVEVLLRHREEIGHVDPALAINIAYGMYLAVVRGILLFGDEHELYCDVSGNTVFRELKRALTLYLRGETSSTAVNAHHSAL